MSFLILPPEINSARMYAGAGAQPLALAGATWDGLAADLHASASSFGAVIDTLTTGPWSGPASVTMAAAAAPYVGWMRAVAGQAELAAAQVRAAATAFENALTATVHPAAVTANRVSLISLVATNFVGQNTPAIAATEFDYEEMWAHDVAAMFGYHAGAASVAATLPPLAVPPTTMAGLVAPAANAVQAPLAASSALVVPVTQVAGLASQIPAALQSLTSAVPVESLSSVAQFATLPVSLLLSPIMSLAQSGSGAGVAATAGLAADVPTLAGDVVTGAPSLGGGGVGPALSAGLGQSHLVGALSVPPTWTGSTPARMAASVVPGLGAAPTAAATSGMTGGTGGMPMMPMPMGAGGAASGMPGGMLGRGGGGSHVVQQRPSVVPRTGIG
jgi:PPE-repeat protein